MTFGRSYDYLVGLVHELCKLPKETSWVEFKHNKADPQEIGEYLSALSNAAILAEKSYAYLIWGIEDASHTILGTSFLPSEAKKGNEELESWLARLLNPRLHFQFFTIEIESKSITILEIPCASGKPTQFEGREFIRVGSNKKNLKDYPELERSLWRRFELTPFEEQVAIDNLADQDILSLIDYPSYFDLLSVPLPNSHKGILDQLRQDGMVNLNDAGKWNITNLGAILFAKDLRNFSRLERKAVRIIVYSGKGRLKTLREQIGRKGYASGHERMIEYINALLPQSEVISKSLRKQEFSYPDLAIRELVANMLIHQDFSITGVSPMIEIFEDRIEITNPGVPLVDIQRFLDCPPRSRNEKLASFMRRINICEERGSGIDNVVHETELHQLPAPKFEIIDGSTRAILFAHKTFSNMDRDDRTRACYLHASLRYVERDPMTNASLRERFGIDSKNSAMVSRVIKETLEGGFIVPYDPEQGKRHAKYIPSWAV